jgi:hypothetical protein
MKKLIAAFALAGAAVAGPALADVGVSIRIGEPGFYGQLDIGGYQPRVVYSRPVIIERRARIPAPIYVRDDWYRNEYAPRYRRQHDHDRDRWDDRRDRHDRGRDGRRDDRRDDRREDHRDDHRDDHGNRRGR